MIAPRRFARRSITSASVVVGAVMAPSFSVFAASEPVSAVDTAAAICAGKLTASDVVAGALSRAAEVAPLNAMITIGSERAVAQAMALDSGDKAARCAPLAGVPFVVKDNIHVAGMPNSAGTPALKSFVPEHDAPVVARLRAAGAIVIAKTNMHELAFGISGYNPVYQTGSDVGVRNAYDSARVAGGSSSGTGAAIGAEVVAVGLGTDTGGSVRIPCAFNGCAGLRPTLGRYPVDGVAPISHNRDTPGAMAKSMADIELLDRVITQAPETESASLKGVRLGMVSQTLANMDADTTGAFTSAVDKLRKAGVVIVDIDSPDLARLSGVVGGPLALYDAYDDMVDYLARYKTGVTIEQLAGQIVSPDVKGTYNGLVLPRKLPGPDKTLVDGKPVYDKVIAQRLPALKAFYKNLFSEHKIEAIVFPTSPIVAMKADPEASSGKYFGLVIQNTNPAGSAGIPGLQLPAGLGAETGLPVGLEINGPAGSDRRLIALGMAFEKILGQLPPPEH